MVNANEYHFAGIYYPGCLSHAIEDILIQNNLALKKELKLVLHTSSIVPGRLECKLPFDPDDILFNPLTDYFKKAYLSCGSHMRASAEFHAEFTHLDNAYFIVVFFPE